MGQNTEPGDPEAELYSVICDAIERAYQNMPADRGPDEAPVMHTSSYARAAASRVMESITEARADIETVSAEDAIGDLREICEDRGWEFSVKVDTGDESAWAAEVRVTQRPDQHGTSDRSLVTYNTGGGDAGDAILPAVVDMLEWLDGQREGDQVQAAEQEMLERLWHYRTLAHPARTAGDLAEATPKLREIEAKHKDLVIEGDFELGVLHGKLSALRWMLGDDWDNYDT